MQYTKEVYCKEFVNEVSKQAYLDCCKWLAKNIYSSPSYSENIVVKIKKCEPRKVTKNGKTVEVAVFKLNVYYTMDLKSANERFCNNCRQMHQTFYQNNPQCSECKLKVFMKKTENEISGIVGSLNRAFGGNDERNP